MAVSVKVGIPGKSSVAGSMMMVLPNSMGKCFNIGCIPIFRNYGMKLLKGSDQSDTKDFWGDFFSPA